MERGQYACRGNLEYGPMVVGTASRRCTEEAATRRSNQANLRVTPIGAIKAMQGYERRICKGDLKDSAVSCVAIKKQPAAVFGRSVEITVITFEQVGYRVPAIAAVETIEG